MHDAWDESDDEIHRVDRLYSTEGNETLRTV